MTQHISLLRRLDAQVERIIAAFEAAEPPSDYAGLDRAAKRFPRSPRRLSRSMPPSATLMNPRRLGQGNRNWLKKASKNAGSGSPASYALTPPNAESIWMGWMNSKTAWRICRGIMG